MAEKLRIKCPCCGFVTDLESLAEAAKKPAEVRVILQKFGGKKPVMATGEIPKKTKQGGAPGYNEYTDITDQVPDQVLKMEEFFKDRAMAFLDGLGKT